VFRAYDSARERLVAVKLFKLDLPPERAHQLVAEFERLIGAQLAHPALVSPLSTGLSGVSAFLAQDYVAADSLDLAVREYGPFPAGDALRIAAQLAKQVIFQKVREAERDNVFAEVFGAVKRAVTVLKMRGSDHDRDIREYRKHLAAKYR
jgi:biotin synthase-related radical SAM superfamily protein